MVALNFNAAQVRPNVSLDPVPSGLYPVMITKSEEKPTKNGQGAYIEFEMTVLQGHEFAGRKVFDRLNIKNQNQQTVDIAYGTLSAICHVTGCLNMTDTQQLHGRPFQAVVVKVPRDDQPQVMTNNIRGYKDMQGNDPGTAGTAVQQTAQPAWAGNGGAPQPQQQAPQPLVQQVQQTQPAAQQVQYQPQPGQVQQQVPQPDPNMQQQVQQPAQPAWAQPGANADASQQTPPWAQTA